MQDTSSAINGCCGLSKGTQSDGLISDTSIEESTAESGSSTENFKDCETFENVVAKEAEELHVGSRDATNSTHSKPSINLHETQARCRSYIRWSVLLSFGMLLWIALWITDVFSPNPFLKENLATAKKITQKAGTLVQPAPITWTFLNLWSSMWDSIISVTTLEIIMFLCFVTALVYLDSYARNATTGRFCCEKIYKTLLNNGAKRSATIDTIRRVSSLEKKLSPIKTESNNCGDNASRYRHGDVKNLIEQHESKINSQLGERRKQRSNQRDTSPKSLRSPCNVNNYGKRSLQVTSGRNYRNFSRRSNNLSQNLVTSELVFKKPNFNLNRVSPILRSDNRRSIIERSNLNCSVFNKSTSFTSEKIETWFELPNSDQAERVMHSFNSELDGYFETCSSSKFTEEPCKELQRYDDTIIASEFGEECDTLVPNSNFNKGIITSSPAFRRFLVNLAKDRMSDAYL